ncbi:MAG: hypothetical protein HC934_14320 [Acaryochloridaceae cyanobacterium SU_2_1]|nr:hypothetical protein [Acaryochloridaceae cyanobacterium SU_2_1]
MALLDPLMAKISSVAVAERLLPHLKQKLQIQPDHVGGYYLTGILVHQYRQQPSVALRFWRKGMGLGFAQGLSLEGSLLFCRAIFAVNPEDSYRIMTRIVGDPKHPPTATALFQKAEQIFGIGSLCWQLLTTAWEFRRWQMIWGGMQPMQTKIDTIAAKFRQGDSIKSV